MPQPLLLVLDDLATIASVRRVLTRAGHSVHLATSTADALSAFEQVLPSVILLAPSVEGGRGPQLLAELRARPASAGTPVVLLGDAVPGTGFPVLHLPVEGGALLSAVEAALHGPELDDEPPLDAGHMEELPPLMDAAMAQAEADLEAEAFAGLPSAPVPTDAGRTPIPGEAPPDVAAAEALTQAAWEEADQARARADTAERARAEAEAARAEAEEALRAYQRGEGQERARRTEAEARARAEAEEARRLEAEARAAHAQVDEARGRAEAAQTALRAAQAQGTAEAELLAAALREEATRRTSELAVQERLRAEAEARAEREARARAEQEARATTEVARLTALLRAREEEALRAQREAEARAQEQATRLAKEAQERDAQVRRARSEAEDWAARERQALSQAERAQAQAQALEVEAAHLAERLAQGERAALEALARAEEALRRERASAEALRGELAAARAKDIVPSPAPAEALPPPRPPEAPASVRRASKVPTPPDAAPEAPPPTERLSWGAADGGQVSLEQLAALLLRLVEVRATARLELRAEETLRILWLADGALAGAASTHPSESLVQQAVADGLLDAQVAAEARALRLPDEALAAELVERGALREAEVVPLLQRCTESRALEALSAKDSTYRLAADAQPPSGGCASERPLSALLAEALRRALPPEEVEARSKGTRAIPRLLRRLDLSPFEFGERERRLLEAVDGERTVLELLSRTGIRQDAGLRALAVAEVLGLVEVAAPEASGPPEMDPVVELQRLQQKSLASEEADYFSVLGLPRTAGTEEVQRAHARLAAEFDPLRYVGHPDPEVPARAARLQSLLDEAARALGDERLRQAYARSLVDGEGGTRAT